MGFFSKIFNGLKKTKDAIAKKLSQIFVGELNAEFYEDLEMVLISSDISPDVVENIIANIKKEAKSNRVKTEDEFKKLLRNSMVKILTAVEKPDEEYPRLITVVGVNGVGKTTALGKLAYNFKQKKKSVLMVAGDTFRAAASDQLSEWAKRANVRIVKNVEGADPGSVVFDGVKSAVAKKEDVVLVDTAGRLHNKTNLMEELRKIEKIISREWNGQILNYLVLDATTGQNALSQMEIFNDIVGIDGIILTKIDGTAKGGVVFSLVSKYNVPIVYIGVGEGIDDLQEFNAEEFVNSII